MLRLSSHNTPHFHVSHSRGLEFSPIPAEDDELLKAIEAEHEDAWQLDPTPDTTALGEFWAGVEQDLHSDSTWNTAAVDEE